MKKKAKEKVGKIDIVVWESLTTRHVIRYVMDVALSTNAASGEMGANATTDARPPGTVENERMPVTHVISLLVLVVVTVASNVAQLLSVPESDSLMRGRSYLMSQCPNVGTLFQVLAVLAIVNCTSQVTLQLMSFYSGRWLFGDVVCQAQGFFTNLMNLLEICYVALLSFERFTHLLQPHEYSLTLSRLNLKVILTGIFFILVISVSGPIYGWGEYKYIHQIGICGLDVNSKNGMSQLIFTCSVFVLFPSLFICAFYVLLMLKTSVQTSFIPCYEVKKIYSGRNNVNTLSAASFFFLMCVFPQYLINLRQCTRWNPTSQTIFWVSWLQNFGLNACFSLCCGLLSCRLESNFCTKLKSKCIKLRTNE